MNWDFMLLSVIWLALAATVLTLYIRIHPSEWGLFGLMVLLSGIWVVVNRSLLASHGIDALGREQLYLWRWMGFIGASMVLAGHIASVIRDPPPAKQVTRRLLIAAMLMVILVFFLNMYLETTS